MDDEILLEFYINKKLNKYILCLFYLGLGERS